MKNSALLFLSCIALSLGVLLTSFTSNTNVVKPNISNLTTLQAQLYLSNNVGSDYGIHLFIPEDEYTLGSIYMSMPFQYGITTMSNIAPGTYNIVISGSLYGHTVTFNGVTKTVDSKGRIVFRDVILANGDYPGVYLN